MSFQVVLVGRSIIREEARELGGLQHGLRGLGGPGTQEVVAAVGELPQVDLVGEQPPLAVPARRGRPCSGRPRRRRR